MKSDFDRRRFLKYVAAGAAGLTLEGFLAACGREPVRAAAIDPTAPPTVTSGAAPAAASPAAPTPTAASASPHLAVARGSDPALLVERAIQSLGGMEKFVKAGSDVIIKPNICTAYHSYEYAATTNPWVVGALVKLCLGAGASRVRVMDYPFGGEPAEAYTVSGIAEQVAANGGEMETMAPFKYVTTSLPNATVLKETDIYDDILKADVLINVPIAKTHSMAMLTLGMKNLMGVVRNREMLHYRMGQNLTDLTAFLKPTLTVIDAVRILTANGPTGGDLNDVKKLDTLIASPDILAADVYAASLFDVDPMSVAAIKYGAAGGIGQSDLSQVKIEEINVGG